VVIATDENGPLACKCSKRPVGDDLVMRSEASLLEGLDHPNIMRMLRCGEHQRYFCIVLEYLPQNLEQLLFESAEALDVPALLRMMLAGLAYLHRRRILHRVRHACRDPARRSPLTPHPGPADQDIKPGNLLLAEDGTLKIGDFGLARECPPEEDLSPHTVTLWYRAPELLLGAKRYTAAVDVWSAGCVYVEMFLRMPLFPGVSDVDQLGKIFHALGTPTDETWPGHRELPCFVEWTPNQATPWEVILAAHPGADLPLLRRTVTLNPADRWTAEECVQHLAPAAGALV